MDEDIKELWSRALRSGDYKQGVGYLKQISADGVPEYCCLGVLCELAVAQGIIPPPVLECDSVHGEHFLFGEAQMTGRLPHEVREWAGLAVADPYLTEWDDNLHPASYYNDTADYDFDQIADLIDSSI